MRKDVEVLTQRDLRVGQVELPRFSYESCEGLAARQLSVRPWWRKSQAKSGSYACRHLPVEQPKCADVFKKRIEATSAKIACPKPVGLSVLSARGAATPITSTQKRIDRTIFLPTPDLTMACSSSRNAAGSCSMARARGSHG